MVPRAAHVQLQRLEGKSDEEKKIEILNLQKQMLESVVDANKKQVTRPSRFDDD